MNKASQCQQIIEWLEKHPDDGITSRDAMLYLNCYRLASRIHDLKRKGYQITSEMDQNAEGIRFARYFLEEVS